MLAKYNISEGDFTVLAEIIHLSQPYKAGKPWKFAGSFYYATTVLTTIGRHQHEYSALFISNFSSAVDQVSRFSSSSGYGHSTPKTDGGKLFTMIYAIIGIPLGLVMFNSIGERLNNFSSIVINKLRRALKARQAETTEMDLICVVSSLSAIVVTLGAAAFSHYEGQSQMCINCCMLVWNISNGGFDIGSYISVQQMAD